MHVLVQKYVRAEARLKELEERLKHVETNRETSISNREITKRHLPVTNAKELKNWDHLLKIDHEAERQYVSLKKSM